MKKILKDIGDYIVAEIKERVDCSDYDGFEEITPNNTSYSLSLEYKDIYPVSIFVNWVFGELEQYEVRVENSAGNELTNIEIGVEEYIKDKIDFNEVYDTLNDAREENIQEYDTWNEHGFASERDYMRWRYG